MQGLLVVWLWVLRVFERDDTDDLAPTMAALDKTLGQAHSVASWLAGDRPTKDYGDKAMGDQSLGDAAIVADSMGNEPMGDQVAE